jgi:pimeloyl-ACP methyl ester carboxylesterase
MPAVMRQMHAAVAHSTWLSIPAAGHLPNIEQPAVFNAAVAAFGALWHRD